MTQISTVTPADLVSSCRNVLRESRFERWGRTREREKEEKEKERERDMAREET